MRIHLVMAVYVLFFASQLSLSRGELACLVLAIGAVMTAEALNTAVEKLCDFAQKNQNRYIRFVKDVAAGAVLLSAVGALLAGVSVVSLGVESAPVSELPPQAVRDNASVSASASAVIFFIFRIFS